MLKKTFKGIRAINKGGMYLFIAKWDCMFERKDRKGDEHRWQEQLIEVSPIGVSQEYVDKRKFILIRRYWIRGSVEELILSKILPTK